MKSLNKIPFVLNSFPPKEMFSYWFSFQLASAGWRACWIGFQHMKGDKQTKK